VRNKEVSDKLYELAEIAEMAGENPFKIKAYNEAARIIENLTIPIEDLTKENKLTEIKGIGIGIAKKIQEYLEKGTISKLEELKKIVPETLLEMGKIPGLGAKRVKTLYEKLNIKTIDELKAAALAHSISFLDGFGEKLEENILKSINEIRDKRNVRFLLGIAYPLASEIVGKLKENSPVDKITVCGSLRRMKETIGDIDILVTSKKPEKVMDYFVSMPLVKSINAKGDTKSSIITFEGIQVDLRVVEPSSYGAAIQYFTGSKEHNVCLREIAIKKNLKLNEYGLFDIDSGRKVGGEKEEGIYEILGLQFIPPEMREDRGEIEFAQRYEIPELVKISDIKGDFHVHSNYSDGSNTIEEMALYAKSLGYEYIVVSDHAKALGVAHGLSLDRFREQKKQIEQINEKMHPFKVFQGVELNILSDGSVDFEDKDLSFFDVCLAGIHTGMNQEESQITKRVIKTLNTKGVRVLVHPTGRIINGRDEYKINVEKVFEEGKRNKSVFEINASFERLDLNDVNSKNAVFNYGLKIEIGTDAHSANSMENMFYGVGVARRAWLTKESIINTMKMKDLESYLRGEL